MHRSLLAGFLAVPSLLGGAVSADEFRTWAVGETVKTTSGNVEGHASAWKSEVSEYLGIPFAQPPVGDLRWEAPVPYKSTGKTIIASKFGPSCPANTSGGSRRSSNGTASSASAILGILGQVGDTFSEDCLTVNVWTKPQKGEKAKAVLVWIYGGGFTTGNSNSPAYNGARLADEHDVVVVSFNYRLNIFGFPGVPFLKEKNLGLLDQRLAVEWVRDNIAGFGGDVKRIVLFGESAGGVSVDFYSYAWTKDPIVSGFIAQSGAVGTVGGNTDNAAAWFKASEKLGCGAANVTELSVSCLRGKKYTEILEAIKPEGGAPALGVGDFVPTIDGKTVFADVRQRRANGTFIRKPLLVGSNNNEAGLFQILSAAGALGNSTSSGKGGKGGLAGIRNQPGIINGRFTCPAADAAKARRDAGVPAWRYRYFGEWPNQQIGPNAGAWHGSEISLVFGTTEYISKKADIAEEVILGNKIRKAWTDFAKNPETGISSNSSVAWPVYDLNGDTLIKLGGPNSSTIEFLPSAQFDSQCGLVYTIIGGQGAKGKFGGLGGLGGLAGIFGKGKGTSGSNNGTRPAFGGFGGKGSGGLGGLGGFFGKGGKGKSAGLPKAAPQPKFNNATRGTNGTKSLVPPRTQDKRALLW